MKGTPPMTDPGTSPEAVERLIAWLMDAHEMGDTSKNPQVWRTLEALSAEHKAAEARERALLQSNDQDRKALVENTSLRSRLKAAEAKLKEAVEVLNQYQLAAAGYVSVQSARDKADAFLASTGGDKT